MMPEGAARTVDDKNGDCASNTDNPIISNVANGPLRTYNPRPLGGVA